MTVTYYGGPSNCSHVELTDTPAVQQAEGGHYVYDGISAYHWHVGAVPAVADEPAKPRTRTRRRPAE